MGIRHQPGYLEIAIERQSAKPGALPTCALLWFTARSAHGETLRQAVETAVNTHPKELFTARSNLAAGRYDDLFNHYAIEPAKETLVSLGIAPAD